MKPSPAHEKAWMKRKNQEEGIKYGCHIELDEDEQPDDCVIGTNEYCMYAGRHKTREGCRWWQRIKSN